MKYLGIVFSIYSLAKAHPLSGRGCASAWRRKEACSDLSVAEHEHVRRDEINPIRDVQLASTILPIEETFHVQSM